MKKLKESSSSSSSSSASSPLKSYRFETRKNFSSTARKIFHDFLKNHLNNPYPNEQEKNDMARESNCTVEQVGTWFVNARVRTLPKLLGLKKQKIKRQMCTKSFLCKSILHILDIQNYMAQLLYTIIYRQTCSSILLSLAFFLCLFCSSQYRYCLIHHDL